MRTCHQVQYQTASGSSIEVSHCMSSSEGMKSSKSTDVTTLPEPSLSSSSSGQNEGPEGNCQSSLSSSSHKIFEPSAGPLHIGGNGPSECTPITPFETIQYVHGGYAAAAPFFCADAKWMLILRHLMPQAHANLVSLLNDKHAFSSMNSQVSSTNSYSENTTSTSTIHNDTASLNPLLIIKWAENNPIVTAFGVIQATKTNQNVNVNPKINKPSISSMYKVDQRELHQVILNRRKPQRRQKNVFQPAIEWDVFLDPVLVKHVDGAMQYLENLTKTNMWSGGLVDNDVIAAANVEVDRQVSRLISRMILAHGSTAQLAMEATGVARSYNFSRVIKGGKVLGKKIAKKQKLFCTAPRSLNDPYGVVDSDNFSDSSSSRYVRSEGIFVNEWLQLFAKALRLGMESDSSIHTRITLSGGNSLFTTKKASTRDAERRGSYNSSTKILDPIFCGLLLCLGLSEPLGSKTDHDDFVMAESARKVSSLIGENLRIILDLKSRHVPARVWARLIDNLNSRGFFVDGIGSFNSDEVRNISNLVSSPINAIVFFHSAGDLQRACHDHKIKNGDSVYFNAGSLMWRKQRICEPATVNCCAGQTYRTSGRTPWIDYTLSESDDDLPMFQPFAYPRHGLDDSYITRDPSSLLEDYQKRFNLNIGLYVQEFAIGPDEIDSLAHLINAHPKLYTLGLAWGGINGFSLSNAEGDGYHSQRYVGSEWNYNLRVSDDDEIESRPGCCAALIDD